MRKEEENKSTRCHSKWDTGLSDDARQKSLFVENDMARLFAST